MLSHNGLSVMMKYITWGTFSDFEASEVIRGAEVVEFLELSSSDLSIPISINFVKNKIKLSLSCDFYSKVMASRSDVFSVKIPFEVSIISVESTIARSIIVAWFVRSGDSVGSVVAILRGDSAFNKMDVGSLKLVML